MEHTHYIKNIISPSSKVLSKRLKFYEKQIIEDTASISEMNPTLGQRVKFLMLYSGENTKCKCGNFLSFDKSANKLFKKCCGNKKCIPYTYDKKKAIGKFKNTIDSKNSVPTYSYSEEQIKEYIQSKLDQDIKPNYFTSLLTDIDKYIKQESKKKKKKITQYLFDILYPNVQHRCLCGKGYKFISFDKGYRGVCSRCDFSENKREQNSIEKIRKQFETTKYSVKQSCPINKGRWKVYCPDCSITSDVRVNNGFDATRYVCRECIPVSKSKMEFDLIEDIKKIYSGEVIHTFRLENTLNKTSYKTIDIFIPEHNLGIELNGVYWHSNNKKSHIEKLEKCNELGIDLIQFTDLDYLHRKNIVLSMIRSKLKLNSKIYARNCEIQTITTAVYRDFCVNNHIKGYSPAKIKLGLFYNNELVSIFSVSNSRFEKKKEECIRYCTKAGITVVGGLSKFIKYYAKSFVTYCDLHYGNGNGYVKSGFQYLGKTQPNYFYWAAGSASLESRQKYQKKKLAKIFPDVFSESKTEKEIMEEAGYLRYYDCGNAKYEWRGD